MKDYKLLLVGLLLLLLIILIGIFAWLWSSNRKNIDPLPIVVNEGANGQSSIDTSEEPNTSANNVLYLQAEDKLQMPLDNVIINFEQRYPSVQVLARYVPTKTLLTLPDTNISGNDPSPFMVNIDLIIANDSFTQTRLLPLQSLINDAQTKFNQNKVNANGMVQDDTANNETRTLASFSYALKGSQVVEGVILTDNPIAISFRNFLLSSVGQDILKNYDYDNIDGYKNSMDDLFSPTSRAKSATGESSVNVADALSNGK
jgi:hypothetical protein